MTAQDHRIWTHPHILAGIVRIRIVLIMHEGRWVVSTYSTHAPEYIAEMKLLAHPHFQAAIEWMDEANARLAKRRAVDALEKVMQL